VLEGELPRDPADRQQWEFIGRHCIVTKKVILGDSNYDTEIFARANDEGEYGTITLDLEELRRLQKFIPCLRTAKNSVDALNSAIRER
jgi:hypothetical protein